MGGGYLTNEWIATAGIATKRSAIGLSVDLVHLSNLYKLTHININKSHLIPQISLTLRSIKEGPTYGGPCGFDVWEA